jgi:hypothetical protein
VRPGRQPKRHDRRLGPQPRGPLLTLRAHPDAVIGNPARAAGASSADWAARAEWVTRSSAIGRSVISSRPTVGVDHAPAAGANRLHPSGDTSSGGADDEMAHRADHQQQAQRVADEPRNADQDSGGEDDQSVEQLPRRHLATTESLLGMYEHSESDAFDYEGSEGADTDQDDQGPEEANLVGNSDERGDLCADEHQNAEEEHTAG